MKINKLIIYLIILVFPLVTSCKDDNKNEADTLKISQKNINFIAKGILTKTVDIQTNSGLWKASLTESVDWCQVLKEGNDKLNITVTENKDSHKRTAKVEVVLGDLKDIITISQLGKDADILVDRNFINLKTVGEAFTIKITTNTEYQFTLPEWIKEDKLATRSEDMIDYTLSLIAEANTDDEERQGVIEIFNQDKSILQKIIVSQKGLDDYSSKDLEGVYDDFKLEVINATASSEYSGEKIDRSHDGDYETIYTSSWSNSAPDYFPIEIVYNLAESEVLDYLIYHPRKDYSSNGHFKEVEIQALYGDNSEFVKIMDYDFKGSANPTKVEFAENIIQPKSVKFIVKSGAGDGQGFAACSEMEFFQKNPGIFDYTLLFTDQTCSELKPNITQEDIENCKNPFYKNLAYFLYNGKYDTEFRVAIFNAYPHPDIQSRINKTSTYSLMDNPTGIYVTEGEEVVIFAQDMQEHKLSVQLQNLDKPDGDGFGGPTFLITSGVNKFKAPHKGLLYVMYHNNSTDDLDTYKSFPPIKLHFASGSVNGYFDKQKHNREDWNRLLNQATSQYFDLVGEYAHITYPVNIFKSQTPDGLALINAYDQLVHDEMDFMGLFKYDAPERPRVFRNRMYFNVMYHSYMYAASYRTGYSLGTIPELADVNQFKTTSIWGPAHEVGHVNQTRPGLRWVGMTEVTNNIHSQYIQTKFGNQSRLQSEDVGEGRNRFELAMTNMFPRNNFSYSSEPDVFCKLAPLWQIQLYFSWVLGNDDIYKDIYEDVRLDPDKGTDGKNQIWLPYRASKAAGYDLTDFFEKWGFFVPIDQELEDYGKARITITTAMADDIKKAIEALNLPKPQQALAYITDRTTELYKSNAKVTGGTYSLSFKSIQTTGCENAVAIEVFDNEKLVFVSTRPNFNLIKELSSPETIRVEAISANGTRISLSKK